MNQLPPRAARGMASDPGRAVCAYCAIEIADVRNGGVTITLWPASKLVLPGNNPAETVFAFCSLPCASHGVVEVAVSSAIAAQGGAG